METNLAAVLSRAYSPYSGIKVAAILVTSRGEFEGVNVENGAFPSTICAERSAIVQAISRFGVKQTFKEIHVASSLEHHLYPCGSCLQVMSEFFDSQTKIIVYAKDLPTYKHRLADLIPHSPSFKTAPHAWKK